YLRTLDEEPKSLTLRVWWNDRYAVEYGIELKIGAEELAALCRMCSEKALAGRVLALLGEAITGNKATREKETQQSITELVISIEHRAPSPRRPSGPASPLEGSYCSPLARLFAGHD